ncbi:MAG: hypothetical protein ABIJ09_09170 [Pseudomonadota bacterium]
MIVLLVPALLLTAAISSATPNWYTGRHAVLLVVDGLGDGELEARLKVGALAAIRRQFVDAGRHLPSSAWWPQRGVGEACSVATGRPQSLLTGDCLLPPELEGLDGPGQVTASGRDLTSVLAALQRIPQDALPPVLVVAHDARFARLASSHGRASVQATAALAQLDHEVDALVTWYQARGLLDHSSFILVSPAGLVDSPRRIDVDRVLAPLLPPRERRQGRLKNLLHAFSPLDVRHRGGVALVQPRRTLPAGVTPAPSTFEELLDATARGRRSGPAVLRELAMIEGVALVVARQAAGAAGQVLTVVNRDGSARLESRGAAQLRYTVVQGRDPLHLQKDGDALSGDRFHAADLWATQAGPWRSAVKRVAGLLELEPGSALAIVAEDGITFDDDGHPAGLGGSAAMWIRGLGTPPSEVQVDLLQLGPSVLAMLGAPLEQNLAGQVVEDLIEVDQTATVQAMCRELVEHTRAAFSSSRSHDSSVLDTSEIRRFGAPPPYFDAIERDLLAVDPLSFLPEEKIQLQIGPRRSLLVATTRLAARIEKLVLTHRPAEIRRFDPLIRPELMLAGFLANPRMRSTLRVLEGPLTRSRRRATPVTAPSAP